MKTGVLIFLVSFITVVVVAAPDQLLSRTKRLTAFGKTPSNSPPPPTTGRGRECKSDRDCDAIIYTSCSTDPRDSRKRCICKDGTHPVNGQCVNRPRERRGYVPAGPGRRHSGADGMTLFRLAPTPPFFPTKPATTTERPLFKPRINLGLRESCTRDADCLEGAECKHNVNATQTHQKQLVCLCIEGRVEMNNECSGAERIMQHGSIVFLLYLACNFLRNNY